MKAFLGILLIIFVSAQLSGCATKYASNKYASNLEPMYGGVEKLPAHKKADEEFIQSILSAGDLRSGTTHIAGRGWSYLDKGDWKTAMKRFNQVWLLDPDYYEAYWGFSAVLHKQRKFAESVEMIDRALSLGPDNYRLFSDAGFAYSNYAQFVKKDSIGKQEYFRKAFAFYKKSIAINPDHGHTYNKWAITLFYNKQYYEAWRKVKQSEDLGEEFSNLFLLGLSIIMSRPAEFSQSSQ